MKMRRGLSRRSFPVLLVIFLLIASGAGAAAASVIDPANTGFPTVDDNCDPQPVITYVDEENMTGCGGYTGTITRTWTATDICGNSADCVQMINITDTTPPVIDCPPDIAIECVETGDISQTGSATAVDNCDPNPNITYEDAVVLYDCGGLITRTWTATDACGNSAQCIQKITIIDDTPPAIYCPPEKTIECDESADPSNTGYATASDICTQDITITYTDEEETYECGGKITRTWKATDGCGNYAECVQIINIVDTTPPLIDCPPDVNIECDDLIWEPEPEPEPEPDPPHICETGC